MNHPQLPQRLAVLVATVVATSCVGPQRLGADANATIPSAAAAASPAQRETLLAERQRRDRAAPGRALLLASPFGPPPAPVTDPLDRPAGSRAGLSIARWEAAELEGLLGGDVVWATVGCCAADEVDLAEGLVHGDMAARNLPPDTPVFVDGIDARLTARLADRLSDAGLTQVLLIRH